MLASLTGTRAVASSRARLPCSCTLFTVQQCGRCSAVWLMLDAHCVCVYSSFQATLEQTVASQESALQSATAQLAAQQHTLVQQAQKLADQEKALAQIAERAQRPLDASALSERLAEALREALTELGANVDKSAVDKLTSALTRSLTSCGKDARALLALPSKLGQEQRSPTMPMPPVSCF